MGGSWISIQYLGAAASSLLICSGVGPVEDGRQ
jgi:hypothetical protein